MIDKNQNNFLENIDSYLVLVDDSSVLDSDVVDLTGILPKAWGEPKFAGAPNTGADSKTLEGEPCDCENEGKAVLAAAWDWDPEENNEKSTAVRSIPSWEAPFTPDEVAGAFAAKEAKVGVVAEALLGSLV